MAAEIQQVRGATLLQLGDSNRSYTVRLACVNVPADQEEQATVWLRRFAPRGTRVNLRPIGEEQGALVARVASLPRGSRPGADFSVALLSAGLATVDALADPLCSGLS